MPSLTRNIAHASEHERKILAELRTRVRYWEAGVSGKKDKWRQAEEKVLAYLPEREVDLKRRQSRENGLPQYTTIQIPYSYAVVMAAYTYLTSVFMGRDPVFQYTGRHGETQQQVQAIEALVSYQVLCGGMQKYLHSWLYDALRYGEGIISCWWEEQIEMISTIAEQPTIDPLTGQPMPGPGQKMQSSQPVRKYAGNKLCNVQPQSFIWDTRVTMREFQRGEFCGERKPVSWNEIIRRVRQGYFMPTVEQALEGRWAQGWPAIEGSAQLERPTEGWSGGQSDGFSAKHPMMVPTITLCVEVIPKDWELSGSTYPEKWVFTCTDDYAVLLGAQPLGAYHCQYPYSIIPLEPDAHGLITRGMPEILEPIQNTVDWLINSHFYNVRAALNNKFVVDPSAVVMKDVLDPLPGGIIRLKPERYGSDTRLAMSQMNIHDVTQSHIADLPMMIGIGERTGGVNDQIMGMLSTGGRKTATEVRTSTSFGINRLKTVAEWASITGFDPLSQMLVANSQQYYDMQLKFQIAGDLALGAGPGFIMVDPSSIAGNYNFVPVDGTLPIDRFAQVELWQQLFQGILSIPAIGMQYDLGGIFTWVAQLAGLKNITQFKIQVTPDQMLTAQAQAGNSVPVKGASGAMATGSAPSARAA